MDRVLSVSDWPSVSKSTLCGTAERERFGVDFIAVRRPAFRSLLKHLLYYVFLDPLQAGEGHDEW